MNTSRIIASGFTLVEPLVVIAIIAILGRFALVGTDRRQKGPKKVLVEGRSKVL